jgi:hypothetical protein
MSTLISSETRVRANWKPEKNPSSRFDRTKIKNAAQIPQTCLEARRKRVMVQAGLGIASVPVTNILMMCPTSITVTLEA